MSPEKKKKLAILGGGIGSLVTAWHLTSQPNWQEIYEIHHRVSNAAGDWEASARAAGGQTGASKSTDCIFGLAFTTIRST